VINRAQAGDEAGEDIAMGSVVYMGRSSFRMEAVVEDALDDGSPRGVTGIVTSPYRTRGEARADEAFARIDEDATEIVARARARHWRVEEPGAPSLPDPLFGSQTDVPVLTAPTGGALPRRRRRVSLSRGTLAAAGVLLFAFGLASGAVARRATSVSARPTAAAHAIEAPKATPSEVAAVAPVEMHVETPTAASPASAPPVIELPEPILVRVHKKTAAAAKSPGSHAAARWVDPFAD
jgi:hypothetical protein